MKWKVNNFRCVLYNSMMIIFLLWGSSQINASPPEGGETTSSEFSEEDSVFVITSDWDRTQLKNLQRHLNTQGYELCFDSLRFNNGNLQYVEGKMDKKEFVEQVTFHNPYMGKVVLSIECIGVCVKSNAWKAIVGQF